MGNSCTLHDELREIVGGSGLLSDGSCGSYVVDGYRPRAVISPTCVREIQAVLRFAAKRGLSVIPAGSGTKLGIGNLPRRVDVVLTTARLNSVVEYEPADLTVTVEAGIRLRELQTVLGRHRQFLAMNPPYAEHCTLGGIVASNASGFLRLRYGTARSQVLGMRVVQADGTVVKSGGKVVKNVAGYDLNKLYIGAYGTLGIITEVSLKLSPIPAQQAILKAVFRDIRSAVSTGLAIVRSQILPMFVNLFINFDPMCAQTECLGSERPDNRRFMLLAGFGGDSEAVSWQLARSQEILEQNGAIGVTTVAGVSQRRLQEGIQEFPANDVETGPVIVKIHLKRTDMAAFSDQIMGASWAAAVQVMGLLGSGVLYLRIASVTETDWQDLADVLTRLRQAALRLEGNLIIETAPPELKRLIDVWGPVGDTLHLMKQVKAKFDVDGLLSPGRFIASI